MQSILKLCKGSRNISRVAAGSLCPGVFNSPLPNPY